MAIDNDELLEWSRIAANRRVQVTDELFPGGLEELNDYTAEEVKDAVKNFRSHPTANQRFSLSANSTKKLVQLTLWVKDRIRLGQDVEFDDATTQAEFLSMIDESQQREKIRQERKKNKEGLARMKIDPPLKASSGWDGWKDSVQTALMLAYGSKGVPLLYVIRTIPASTFPVVPAGGVAPSWEELAIGAAPLSGLDYDADIGKQYIYSYRIIFRKTQMLRHTFTPLSLVTMDDWIGKPSVNDTRTQPLFKQESTRPTRHGKC
jgi:hypothetical protein